MNIRKYETFIIWFFALLLFFISEAKADTYEEVKGHITTTLNIVDIVYGGDPLYSPEMVDLLLLTLSVESDFCRNNNGVGSGGEGAYQLNLRNAEDIYKNFLKYKKQNKLLLKANHYKSDASLKYDLTNNFDYATVLAAIHYKRRLKSWIPSTPWEAAYTWKQVYNTRLGKGNAKEAYKKYNKYCRHDFLTELEKLGG